MKIENVNYNLHIPVNNKNGKRPANNCKALVATASSAGSSPERQGWLPG